MGPLGGVRATMEQLVRRCEPSELNRIGLRLYEAFRPDVPHGSEGWGKNAVLESDKIRAAG
jgi:hypothetical protein